MPPAKKAEKSPSLKAIRVRHRRACGVLLHVSSLPSHFGIGDFGPGAYHFVDFLKQSGQSFWQILPLNPTEPFFGNSPYSGLSAFAGNRLYISPQLLFEEGYLRRADLQSVPSFPKENVDYERVNICKERLFEQAFQIFMRRKGHGKGDFAAFCSANAYWLEDYALFMVLRQLYGGRAWSQWARECAARQSGALERVRAEFAKDMMLIRFLQFSFFKRWDRLRRYSREAGVSLVGDMPIYVNYDSADVWSHQRIFKLNKDGSPRMVAGVPPDYFSATGQRWGNPVYDWKALAKTKYRWWVERFRQNLRLFDWVRMDHFRGFVAAWEIPAHERTAVNGRWVKAPVAGFLRVLVRELGRLPLIAEDLGVITKDVREVMEKFHLPGMKLLLFAFDGQDRKNPYLPENIGKESVVYTGTHDNNTVVGWWKEETREPQRDQVSEYLGHRGHSKDIHWEFIRMAFQTEAWLAVVPMQDILGLDSHARMNKPASYEHNWEWRLTPQHLSARTAKKLLALAKKTHRLS